MPRSIGGIELCWGSAARPHAIVCIARMEVAPPVPTQHRGNRNGVVMDSRVSLAISVYSLRGRRPAWSCETRSRNLRPAALPPPRHDRESVSQVLRIGRLRAQRVEFVCVSSDFPEVCLVSGKGDVEEAAAAIVSIGRATLGLGRRPSLNHSQPSRGPRLLPGNLSLFVRSKLGARPRHAGLKSR